METTDTRTPAEAALGNLLQRMAAQADARVTNPVPRTAAAMRARLAQRTAGGCAQ